MHTDTINTALLFEPIRHRGLKNSAWIEHLAFANTLVKQFQPSLLVELGTHWGASYFAFCQAVKENRLPTRCYAVDTWQGEQHAGNYDKSVYDYVTQHNQKHYSDFSQLLHKTFDEAVDQFSDGSIDLLHIDGLHTYEAVKNDFDRWWPKVKQGGILLLHDICCRHEDFGVWKLWEEIRESYPLTFSFLHGYGLGVLVKPTKDGVHPFLEELTNRENEETLRILFGTAGKSLQQTLALEIQTESLEASLIKKDRSIEAAQHILGERECTIEELQTLLTRRDRSLTTLQNALDERTHRVAKLEEKNKTQSDALEALKNDLERQSGAFETLKDHLARQTGVIKQMQDSLCWKATLPLRLAHRSLRPGLYNAATIRHCIDYPQLRRIYNQSETFQISGWCFHIGSGKPADRIFIQIGNRQIPCRKEPRGDVANIYDLTDTETGFRAEFTPSGRGFKHIQVMAEHHGEVVKLDGFVIFFKQTPHIDRPPEVVPEHEKPRKMSDYDTWCLKNRWNTKRRLQLEAKLKNKTLPTISVIMPVYNPSLTYLKAALQSIELQANPHWELCVADDCSTDPQVRPYLEAYAAGNERVKVVFREENGHISAATNTAAEMATGDFFVFVDQDDTITPDALAEIALYAHDHPDVDVIYSDDDKIDANGNRFSPQFKPDWSPELLLSFMYFGHIFSVRGDVYREIGGTRLGYEGSQDYDLALRATERARQVGHIAKILYHWRALPSSLASGGNEKVYSFTAGIRAVQDALDRRHIPAKAYQPEWAVRSGCGYFSHCFGDDGPSVGIIIPTRNQAGVLSRLLQSLEKTTYTNVKIYIVDNESDERETLDLLESSEHHVFRIPDPEGKFNHSFLNNAAASRIKEDLVLFLNNDTEVIRPEWLSQMVGYLHIDGVAAVGARLLYPDQSVQHAGVIHGLHCGLPGHAFKHLAAHENGYMGFSNVLTNYSGVTAACLLMRREEFISIGGFNQDDFAVSYNDVDLCYRLVERGRRIVYTPTAELYHHEGYSRGRSSSIKEEVAFIKKYQDFQECYYNPNLLKSQQTHLVRGRCLVDEDFRVHGTRVGFFTHNLNLEGAPIQLLEIAEGLKERYGIKPILFSLSDGLLRKRADSADIKVVLIPPEVMFNIQAHYVSAMKRLTSWFQPFDLSAVIANTIVCFWAVELSRNLSLKSLWIIHESEPPFSHLNDWCSEAGLAARESLGYTYQNVFVSQATRNLYTNHLTQSNASVIHNGLCPDKMARRFPCSREKARKQLNLSDQDVLVLTVGTICERKGQVTLLKAAGRLEKSFIMNARFAVVGKQMPEYRDTLDESFEALPESIQRKISFHPETWDIGLYYAAADIFVCSSKIESFPKVILEAMYSGIAILTTPVFGITEQVTDGVSAKYFTPDDSSQLATFLEELISDPDERQRLGANAKLQLQRLPDYQKMLLDYRNLLAESLMQ